MIKNNLSRKKIVVFISTLKTGGSEKQSIILSRLLSQHHDVTLVVLYGDQVDSKQLELLNKYGVQYNLLNGNILSKGLAFRKFINKNFIDIIFCFLPRDNLFVGIFAFRSICSNIIGGVRLDGNLFLKDSLLYLLVKLGVIKRIIFNSYSSCDAILFRNSIKDRCHVIHNCIDSLESAPLITNKINNVKILTVGRFVENKDFLTALKSIKILNTMFLSSDFKLEYLIIGYGKLEKDIKQWIKELGLAGVVTVIINPPNLSKYYRKADIYLSTSLKEGLSNSIMEAMTHSLPIVATNVGDAKYLVNHEVNGFVCNQRDSKELSNALFNIIIDNDLRLLMSENSLKIVESDFSCEKFEGKYSHFINQLCN